MSRLHAPSRPHQLRKMAPRLRLAAAINAVTTTVIKRTQALHARMSEAASERPIAIIDGSNVAHATEGDRPVLENIRLVSDKLQEEGYQAVVVVDAALRHQIDDPDGYERMVDRGGIRQAPAGTDADYFILSFARELEAVIVSNDRFRDREEAFSDVLERIIRFMVLEGEVVLERRTSRRP